jgi:hypothetical protein
MEALPRRQQQEKIQQTNGNNNQNDRPLNTHKPIRHILVVTIPH